MQNFLTKCARPQRYNAILRQEARISKKLQHISVLVIPSSVLLQLTVYCGSLLRLSDGI
jgi:hypothetical protein